MIGYIAEITGIGGVAGVRNELIRNAAEQTGAWSSDDTRGLIMARRLPMAICAVTLTHAGTVPIDYRARLRVSQPR